MYDIIELLLHAITIASNWPHQRKSCICMLGAIKVRFVALLIETLKWILRITQPAAATPKAPLMKHTEQLPLPVPTGRHILSCLSFSPQTENSTFGANANANQRRVFAVWLLFGESRIKRRRYRYCYGYFYKWPATIQIATPRLALGCHYLNITTLKYRTAISRSNSCYPPMLVEKTHRNAHCI